RCVAALWHKLPSLWLCAHYSPVSQPASAALPVHRNPPEGELFLCSEIDQVRPAQGLFVCSGRMRSQSLLSIRWARFSATISRMASIDGQRAGDATGPELQPELIDLAFQRPGNHASTAPPVPSRLESVLCIRRQGPYLPHCPRQSCRYGGQPSSHET